MARARDILLVVIAVANISTASILVRLSGVPGFVAAAWRLAISAGLTVLFLAVTRRVAGLRAVPVRDLALILVSGTALALHFGLWMMSLYHLSVAASVTIVDSYPALIALVGRWVLGERYTPAQLAGAVIAMAGVFGLARYSSGEGLAPPGGDPVLGAALSLAGMVAVAVYFVIGKILRARMGTAEYTGAVYSVAAAVAVAIAAGMGDKLLGYDAETYAYLVGLALFPMLGGHTIINHVLPRMSLLAATVPVLGEPVGAAILAWIFLGEPVPLGEAAWMLVVLLGIALVLLYEPRR